MYVCIISQSGEKVFHRRLRNSGKYFVNIIGKFGKDVAVGVESTFNWYWLADLCQQAGIKFVLGHAVYMRAIHGAKAKNDRIDSEKIARLLRGGMFPEAYVYPAKMRATRDLMRRRLTFVRQRAGLLGHIQLVNMQYNQASIGHDAHYKSKRDKLPRHFRPAGVRRSIEADLELIKGYDSEIRELERYILKAARVDGAKELELLQSIPGVGKVLSLTLLYEIHTIERFPRVQDFCSYSRAVRCRKESAGKTYGFSGAKMGNPYIKWALSEAAVLGVAHDPILAKFYQTLERKHETRKAKAVMRAKLARAIYYMLKRHQPFDIDKFKS
jgi:transposase